MCYCSEPEYLHPQECAGDENLMIKVNAFATMGILHHLICKANFHTWYVVGFFFFWLIFFFKSSLENLHWPRWEQLGGFWEMFKMYVSS